MKDMATPKAKGCHDSLLTKARGASQVFQFQ